MRWTPQVQKTSTWSWMRAVYVRMGHTGGTAQVSWNEPRPSTWDGLSLARIDAGEIDIFDPHAPPPPPGTILPHPLRVLSLPDEPLQVGDRRMVRPKLGGLPGEFEAIIICHAGDEDPEVVIVEVGGSRAVRTLRVSRELFRRLLPGSEPGSDKYMLRIGLQRLPLDAEPVTLEQRFNTFLEGIQDADEWFEMHIVEGSGRVAAIRLEAYIRDESRIARWLHDVSSYQRRWSQDEDE